MSRWILLMAVAGSACSVDSTGLLPMDTGVRFDVRIDTGEDAGPDTGPVFEDAGPPDTLPDVPQDVLQDVPQDIPQDTPQDVPLDTFDGGPGVPEACSDSTLVACYLFDGNVLDSSANARHLTAVSVGFEPGTIDDSLQLDDTSEVSAPGVALGVDFSAEFWFQMKEPLGESETRRGVIDAGGSWNALLFPGENDAESRLRMDLLGRRTSVTVSTRGWHHVVLVSTASSARYHVDGATREVPGAASSGAPSDLHVGSSSGDSFDNKFIGNIDHLRIWDRALSTAEAEALFPAE